MAVVDLDRHILSKLTSLQAKMKDYAIKFQVEWKKVQAVKEHTDVLLFVADDGCEGVVMGGTEKRTPQCAKRKETLWKERNKIMNASKKVEKYATAVGACINQQDALLTHLVSRVDNAHTGKGSEGGTIKEITEEAEGNPQET